MQELSPCRAGCAGVSSPSSPGNVTAPFILSDGPTFIRSVVDSSWLAAACHTWSDCKNVKSQSFENGEGKSLLYCSRGRNAGSVFLLTHLGASPRKCLFTHCSPTGILYCVIIWVCEGCKSSSVLLYLLRFHDGSTKKGHLLKVYPRDSGIRSDGIKTRNLEGYKKMVLK